MGSTSVANVARNSLPADTAVTKRSPSNQSGASLTTSRVTLVDTDPDFTVGQNSKYNGTPEATTFCPPKYTWLDHFLGVFCINVPKRKTHNEYMRTETPITSEIDTLTWPSPWILPVYVYPKAQKNGNSLVPKVAKCTIDTGNLQGNIVSREFAEEVLGYSAVDFHKLTKEEERGGIGITGDLHMPQGAIYLTWYHRNSTRVFRNMRFLISPYQGCDLIIGARSIQKDKILTVPCLADLRTVKPDPATTGKLHGKIWQIDNYITTTLQDRIDWAIETDGKTEGLEKEQNDLRAIHGGYWSIWKILFDPEEPERNFKQKQSAADTQFNLILGHPVDQQTSKELELEIITEGLRTELRYTEKIPEHDGGGGHDLRRRDVAKGSTSSSSRG